MKKILFTTALLSTLILTGCAGGEEKIASYKSGEVTEAELVAKMKENYGEDTLQQMIIEDVLVSKYGDKVSEETVLENYNKEKSMYGSEEEFVQVLESSGYTETSYKDIIKYSLLMEETVKDHTDITEDELKVAYEEYVPAVTAAHILVEDEDTAKDLIKQIKDGADFATLAQENSIDYGTAEQGGELQFSTGEMVPEFEEAAFALNDDEVTENPVQSDYGFHIIKMIDKNEKGTLEEEKEELESNILTYKISDSAYVFGILSDILKDEGIEIVDADLAAAMDEYLKVNETVEEQAVEQSEESTEESTEETPVEESKAEESESK